MNRRRLARLVLGLLVIAVAVAWTSAGAPTTAEPTPPRQKRRRRRWRRRVLALVIGVTAVGLVDGFVMWERIHRVDMTLPGTPNGSTYLVIGSDSRAFVRDETDRERFGSPTADAGVNPEGRIEAPVRGARADLVFVVRVADSGATTLLGVPRDLLVFEESGAPTRLSLTMLDGVQSTVDALCRSLGVGVDHVVILEFDGFREVIDASGGIDLDVVTPLRDPWTGIELTHAGPHHFDGEEALAYVRSRRGEVLRNDGRWVPEENGADGRTARAREVMAAVADDIRASVPDPVQLHRLAWAGSGALTVDSGTGLWDLARLVRALEDAGDEPDAIATLPVRLHQGPVPIAELLPDSESVLRRIDARVDPDSTHGCAPRLLRRGSVATAGRGVDDEIAGDADLERGTRLRGSAVGGLGGR